MKSVSMRYFTFLFIVFSLSTSSIFGQSYASSQRVIFPISALECQQLLEFEVENLDFLLERTPLDSAKIAAGSKHFDDGHYISIQAYNEAISWRIISRNRHSLYLHQDNKQLNIAVVDEQGKAIEDGTLFFEKKEMKFDSDQKNFKNRRTKNGLLIAYLPSDTVFYTVEGLQEKSLIRRRLNYFSKSKVGFIVTSPVRWVSNGTRYLKRGIRNGNWRVYHWPMEGLYHRIFHPQRKQIRGYVASNQPVYRIGDTVKISAYITTPRGKPYKKPLNLSILGPGLSRNPHKLTESSKPGYYEMTWVAGDSLKLDAQYSVEIHGLKKRHHSRLYYRFKIEDYQLDEYRFELLTQKATFDPNDPVVLDVKVADTNGLSIPSTTIDGHIFTNSIKQIYTDSLLIPDTLWQFHEEMGNRTTLSLLPPDSIWPLAQLAMGLHVDFLGPSGEGSEQNTSFTVNRPEWIPMLVLKGDSLIGFIANTLTNEIQEGQLTTYQGSSKNYKQTVSSSFSMLINPYAENYHWAIGGKATNLNLASEESLVSFDFNWINDTLHLQWANPRGLPITWSLKSSSGAIENKTSSEKIIAIALSKNQNKRQIWLHYSYPWAGSNHQKEQDLKALNEQLEISLEVPEKIYPGQTENVTISVKDTKGKPVQDVALTAGAYNAQFRENSPYVASKIRFKNRRTPFVRQKYHASKSHLSGLVPLNLAWYKKLNLDTQLYNRIRFPDTKGLFEYRALSSKDSLSLTTAQVAPWLVQNGKLLSIHLIYLDNRLVYYDKAWQNTPYSIVAEPGYHELTLRTAHGELFIDSILLKAGHVLDMSIDLSQYDKKQVIYTPKNNKLYRHEIDLLEKRLFYMRPLQKDHIPQYLYQDSAHIFQLLYTQNKDFAWGLFDFRKDLHWVNPGRDSIKFLFEPYHSFLVGNDRDRLYHHRPLSEAKEVELATHLAHPKPNNEAIFPADMVLVEPKEYYQLDNFPTEAAQNRGRVQLFYNNFSAHRKVLMLSRGGEIRYLLHPNTSSIVLPAGDYTLSWVNEDNTIIDRDISVVPYHLLALRLNRDDLNSRPISKSTTEFLESKKRWVASRNNNLYGYDVRNSPYFLHGRLLSGFITTEEGEALIGATIFVNGTTSGTITDLDGYYELWVPLEAAEINVSYTGFKSIEFDPASKRDGSVVLSVGNMLMESVVISASRAPEVMQDQALTSQKLKIRGSRSELSSYYIDGLPVRNINALAATVAGISVTDGSDPDVQEIGFSLDNIVLPLDSIRDGFSDYAYWQPILSTGKSGKVTFKVTFPDDITNWKHFVLGVDRKSRLGLMEAHTSAYLPLQAQLYTPRFLLEGDQSSLKGVLTNRTGQNLKVSTFLQQTNGKREQRTNELGLSMKEEFTLDPVPYGIDTLEYSYGLQADAYKDGELRQIPVFPIGSKRTVGGFMVLNKDTSYQVQVDPIYGPLDMRIGGNGLPQLIEKIEWLRHYPYGCNEQTASRLLALLAIKKLPSIDANDEKIEKEILSMIHRLDKNRSADNNWGWWKSSLHYSSWITRHVLTALRKAEQMGYRVPNTDLAIRNLLGSLNDLSKGERLNALLFLAEREQPLDYTTYLEEFDSIPRPLRWEMSYRRIQQLQDIPYQLDSISKFSEHTLTGARYWGSEEHWHYRPSRQAVNLTLQAYQLYRDAGMTDSLAAIQQYFMESDHFHAGNTAHGQWSLNTYEGSNMVEVLLPDLLGADMELEALNVTVNQVNEAPINLDSFPQKIQLLPIAETPIDIDKSGDGPAFLSYYQAFWDTDPPIEKNGFKISTEFKKEGKRISKFEVGQNIQMIVDVEAEAGARYVLVEVPVPAGCSYGKKVFRESQYETHREYKRDRVAIFLQNMPTGKYQFTVPLEARFSGTYSVNPARVEMMYVPSFNGSTELKEVVIE